MSSLICVAQSNLDNLHHKLNYGEYQVVIEECSQRLENESNSRIKFQLYELLAEAHLNLGQLPDYLISIKQSGKYNPSKKTKHILFDTHLAEYYQHMQMPDSAIHHAQFALQKVGDIGFDYDSTLTAYVFSNYANAMRNGGAYNRIIANAPNDFDTRNQFLKTYLDTAIQYATSNKQLADTYSKIGTMYSDQVAAYLKNPSAEIKEVSILSIKYLLKAIALEKSPARKARGHALIGLNQFYVLEHQNAEKSFQKALNLTRNDNKVVYPNIYLTICNWSGSNYEDWYKKTDNIDYLLSANDIYRNGVKQWKKIIKNSTNLGYNDSYHTSTINRLVPNCISLFEVTKDSNYLYNAFEYADLTKYPSIFTEPVQISDVQSKLQEDEAFIHYCNVSRPMRHFAFCITKDDIAVIELPIKGIPLDSKKLKFLYDFSDISKFKKTSYWFYQEYFEEVDKYLREIGKSKITISNSDMCSMLNLDVLISDTLSNTWKSQPYLFLKYNMSYALSARSFVQSRSIKNSGGSFNISIGEYQDEANLRFSKELSTSLSDKYKSKITEFEHNLMNSSISLLLSHGVGSYYSQSADIKTSTNQILSTSDIYNMRLNNDLVMFMACNTNSSQQYYGEGATGNFAKALRCSGSKSSLTTSWEIDDKSNAFIIEKFIDYLSEGLPKNEALWQAKKDYWRQNEQDEEFKPLYWAPYVLTGNIDSVKIQKKEHFNLNWLWLLTLIPVGIIIWRKFN